MQHILDVQIPDENPQGAPGGDFQNIATSPDMFGALGARALQSYGAGLENLGSGLTKAGDTGLDIATQQNELQNRVHAADVRSWYADQTTDLHSKFMSLSGRAALDALPQYKQQLADLRQQALEKVPSPQSKAMLNDSLTTLQDQYYRYWSGHAGGQLKSYQDKVAQDAIASSSALAVNSLLAGDQLGFERRLREQDVEVHNYFGGQGFEQPDIDAEAQKRRGVTLKNAIETVAASGDVGRAQALFDKYKNRMDPQSVLAVTANLKSGVAQLQGRGIADEESGHILPKAEAVADVPASFVAQVKRMEGFAPQARWDVKQFSNGYGTRAKFEGESIDREEADKRFQAEFTKAAKIVDGVNPNLDPGTRAALSSLTYNAGDAWTTSGLGAAVRAGDLHAARDAFLRYNQVDGQTNEAIAMRRYRESQWFGSNDAPAVNGPLVDKQQAYERVLARTDSNPLQQSAAMARLQQIYGIYRAQEAGQHADFDLRLQDTKTEAMATGSATKPLNEADFVNRYGALEGGKQYAEYQKDLALGADIAGLAGMSPEEQAQVLARHQPAAGSEGYAAELSRQQQVAKAIAHVAKERDDDPAAFAIRRLPEAQSAFRQLNDVMADQTAGPQARQYAARQFAEVTLAAQARAGVAPENRAILTADQVARISGAIGRAATADDPAQRQAVQPLINAQKDLWGSYWPQIVPQIAPPGAAPLVKAIAGGADPGAMQRLLDIPKGESPAKILKEQNEVSARNLSASLNIAFAPFLASMVGFQKDRDYSGYMSLGNELAALYVRDGKSEKDAAAQAFDDLIGKRYEFRDSYRIPKSPDVNPDDVQRGAYVAMQDIKRVRNGDTASPFGDLALARNNMGVSDSEADTRNGIAHDGRFVTAPGNDGLNIVVAGRDESGRPAGERLIKNSKGQPILLTWDQLQAMGGTQEARDAAFSRDLAGRGETP